MKLLDVNDKEVITMDDYPIHDLLPGASDGVILKLYFRVFEQKCWDIVERVQIIDKDLVVESFEEAVKEKFVEFLKSNLEAKYFCLGGQHRSTAASLTKNKIPAQLLETDADCKELQKLNNTSGVFRTHENNTIAECVDELKNHFKNAEKFCTVYEKTKRMVEDMDLAVPQYMRDSFNT